MVFQNRLQAAHLLADRLQTIIHEKCLVLAIPRGAVPMAAVIARQLHTSLNLVPVRKVSSPLAPEFALGAADVEGNFYPEEGVFELPPEQLRVWFKKSLETLRHRDFRWRQILPREPLRDRVCLIVDDGIATGATMRAALMWARRKEPKKIIVAVPVSSREGADLIHRFADQVVCLETPIFFSAVGEFYNEFEEVTDEQVCGILRTFIEEKQTKESSPNI